MWITVLAHRLLSATQQVMGIGYLYVEDALKNYAELAPVKKNGSYL